MDKRILSPSGRSCAGAHKGIAVGIQNAFGPVISAEDIKIDGDATRRIEEIRADIDLCLACLEARGVCNKHCEECAYLPYEDHFPALAQENYIAHQDRKKRMAAIEGIATDRLIEICNAEREKRCLVLPEA